jgi:hypothetical protein
MRTTLASLILATTLVHPAARAQPGGGPLASAMLTRDVRAEFAAAAPALHGKSPREAHDVLAGVERRLQALASAARAAGSAHRVVVMVGYVKAIEPGTKSGTTRRRTENFVLLADNWSPRRSAGHGRAARAYPGERSQCTGTVTPPPSSRQESIAQLLMCVYPR